MKISNKMIVSVIIVAVLSGCFEKKVTTKINTTRIKKTKVTKKKAPETPPKKTEPEKEQTTTKTTTKEKTPESTSKPEVAKEKKIATKTVKKKKISKTSKQQKKPSIATAIVKEKQVKKIESPKKETPKSKAGGATALIIKDDVPDMAEDGSKIHTVIIPSNKATGASQFNPIVIRIKAGESIAWINEDARTHFINEKPAFQAFTSYDTEDDDDDDEESTTNGKPIYFNSPVLNKGDKWVFKITKKGTINYYCFTHPTEMVGTIIVE